MNAPRIYSLANPEHAARFEVTPSEARFLLGRCYPNRRRGGTTYKVLALVFHIQEGNTVGSMQHFQYGKYANGDPVSASCTYTIQKDGSILLMIPEKDAPWTNGPVRNPTSRGKALAARAGGDPNNVTISVEMEGFHNREITEAQMVSAEWLARDVTSRYDLHLQRDVYEHADFDRVQRANCAGPYYDALALRLAKQHEDPPVTSPAFGTITRFDTPRLVTVTASAGLNVRQWGELDAMIYGTDRPGSQFWASGWVVGESVTGENRWYIEASRQSARRWAGGTDRAGLN